MLCFEQRRVVAGDKLAAVFPRVLARVYTSWPCINTTFITCFIFRASGVCHLFFDSRNLFTPILLPLSFPLSSLLPGGAVLVIHAFETVPISAQYLLVPMLVHLTGVTFRVVPILHTNVLHFRLSGIYLSARVRSCNRFRSNPTFAASGVACFFY